MRGLVMFAVVLVLVACDEKPKDRGYLGYVEGERVTVAAPESGWVEETFVAEGDTVVILPAMAGG